jgi:type IV pilus assembly protein PilM
VALSSKDVFKFVDVLKDVFSFQKKTLFGLDIGMSSVKVSYLDCRHKDNNFTLLKYASVALPEGAIIEDEIQKPEEIISAIEKALSKAGIGTKFCAMGISGPSTVARRLQLAGGSDEEVEDQVLWESEQYLPFDIEDSKVSYQVLGENDGGGIDVVVAAAKNDVVFGFKELVDECELKPKIMDLGILALVNVFEIVESQLIAESQDSFLILDIGAQKTSFVIYKNGMITFNKEVNIGGVVITEEIQRQLGVNYYEAEELKIVGDEKGNLPEEVVEIIDEMMEAFFTEIKKTLDFYISSTSDESLSLCFITGGSAQLPGVTEGLSNLLGVEVELLNPFKVISYKEKNFPEGVINDIAFRGVVALGLGMRRFR